MLTEIRVFRSDKRARHDRDNLVYWHPSIVDLAKASRLLTHVKGGGRGDHAVGGDNAHHDKRRDHRIAQQPTTQPRQRGHSNPF